ncbi:ureidoglycolate dehydrogenase [Rossellomorea aquimaris]|uniref:Ureidoglycolate dehydrogenase n=1 Tax=Rossellomorea aquimaris TaxID=189382 RepID=A0A5D4UMP6_9BACI|nr:ureidoglycolate dehydrogenase [Rossellomorea aquimaris]TYS81816.1 ureidoglycolate dehydrogenase [Rossellomorea aquimaris]TYS88440.1 ureidoglycolate dehydrogenase [Rossellomorea aquimaris]
MGEVNVSHEELRKLAAAKLIWAGLDAHHAGVVADVLVHADLRGVSSHGVLRTEHYVRRLHEGGLNKNPSFSFEQTGPCSGIFNGDDGLGHVVAKNAMEEAIKLAKNSGIGMITVTNSSHCGALSYFVQQAAVEGLIGVAMTHTDKIVVPFGGAKPFLGTNPIAYGFPAKNHKPIILDMATSNVALGKILYAKEAGKEIPEGWGVDEQGNATTDPEKVSALTPFAGPKGYGLGMVVDIFSGLLAGAAFGPHISKMYGEYNQQRKLGHYVCAINPTFFTNKEEFLGSMDRMIDELHAVKPAEGFNQVFVPGEPEQIKEEKQLREGVLMTETVYQYLQSTE